MNRYEFAFSIFELLVKMFACSGLANDKERQTGVCFAKFYFVAMVISFIPFQNLFIGQ